MPMTGEIEGHKGMEAELDHRDFDKVVEESAAEWNAALYRTGV